MKTCPTVPRCGRWAVLFVVAVAGLATAARATDGYVPFDGPKTAWHGYDRYDFLLDEQTGAAKPFLPPAEQGNGIKGDAPAGQRRCVVVVPKVPAAGNPWSWQGCYWDHQPQAEVELLRRGFHVAYVLADATHRPDATWDAWYAFLTEKHGLSRKPAFVGMSRGGEYAYTWATLHPERVSCIYADNPGGNKEFMARLGDLARADVPLLHVCGSIDPLLWKVSDAVEAIYPQFGGRISVLVKEGYGHHPHSLRDPKPIADFIEQSVKEAAAGPAVPPDWVGRKPTRTAFCASATEFAELASEKTHATYRGPFFLGGYDRWSFDLPSVEGAVTVIAPRTPAAGKPWVFRADAVRRESGVDLALLARGFHVATGPVPYNADGPKRADWDAVYQHLTSHGFSKKPVMEGNGAAAGEAFAWALANAEKVGAIYGESPIFRRRMIDAPLLDDLTPIAKARVPLVFSYGNTDTISFEEVKRLEERYVEAMKQAGLSGGKMWVHYDESRGRQPSTPSDFEDIVSKIALAVASAAEPASGPATRATSAAKPNRVDAVSPPPVPAAATRPDTAPSAGSFVESAGTALEEGKPSVEYRFSGPVPRPVLERYLARSISMEGLLNGRGDLTDNLRMLKETGAKFVGRGLCLWGNEANLLANLDRAREQVRVVRQQLDSDVILQACVFETVSTQVEQVPVPAWAFTALGRVPEARTFRYADMIYADPKLRRDWGRNASVPDVSRPETQLWFYFLARSYLDLGFEAIHFGQVELMGRNDPDRVHWARLLGKVREYAGWHAPRRWVFCDGHVPSGGLVHNGKLLLDFHSFPLRIMESPGKGDAAEAGAPDGPQRAALKVGFSDGIYGRSKGGVTPSGWACDHLPYLVEIDNWGVSKTPGEPAAGGIWVWGYDEITWFAHQPKEYRAKWLRYAWEWVRRTDPAGYLQMPGSRTARSPRDEMRWYHANRRSDAVPQGLGDEDTIREIWEAGAAGR